MNIRQLMITACATSALFAFSGSAGAQTAEAEGAAATEANSRLLLFCSANGATDFSMNARFRQRDASKDFKAEFEAAPNVGFRIGQRLAVMVGSVRVAIVTLRRDPTNGDFIGGVEYSSRPDDRKPFPANFPAVRSSTRVTVGPIGCALR